MVSRIRSAIPRSPGPGGGPPAWGLAVALLGLATGCAHGPLPGVAGLGVTPGEERAPRYAFFERPAPGDPWTRAVASWRRREGAARRTGRIPPFPSPLPPVSAGPAQGGAPAGYALADHYDRFLAERRRALARDVLAWIQDVARERFVADGPIDHWPTLDQVLRSVGDDCDGLELLAYHALRQLGFPADAVYRAVVVEPATGRHHMVTLWFEEPDDPWMLDPTNTIASRLRRLSQEPGWVPLKLFSEDAEYTVTRLDPPVAVAGQGPAPAE